MFGSKITKTPQQRWSVVDVPSVRWHVSDVETLSYHLKVFSVTSGLHRAAGRLLTLTASSHDNAFSVVERIRDFLTMRYINPHLI